MVHDFATNNIYKQPISYGFSKLTIIYPPRDLSHQNSDWGCSLIDEATC